MKSATTWQRWRQSHKGSQWCPGCWRLVRYWEFSDCCPGISDTEFLADDLHQLELCVLVPNFVLVSRRLWISNCSGDRNVHCLSLISCYRLWVHWSSHWQEEFGAKFWRDFLAPFFKQTMRDRNLHSSFVISFWYSQSKHWIYLAVDTKNFNKVLWRILFKIIFKFDKRLY